MLFGKPKTKLPLTVFLDVDGVLNRESDWRTAFALNEECVAAFKELIAELQKYYIVKGIVDHTCFLCLTYSATISSFGNICISRRINNLHLLYRKQKMERYINETFVFCMLNSFYIGYVF